MLDAFKPYLRYCRGQRRLVAASAFLSFVQAALLVPIALTVQAVFDRVLPERDVAGLVWRALLIPLLFAASGAVVLLNRHVTLRAVKSSVLALRVDLLKNAVSWSRERYARLDGAETHARIVQDTERVDCMASALLSQFVPGVIVSVALSTMLLWRNPALFLLLCVALPVGYVASNLVSRALKRRVRAFHDDFSAFSKGTLFVLQFSELIASSSAETVELGRQRANVETLRASSHAMALFQTAYGVIQNNVLMLVGAAVLLVGGLATIDGTLTIGGLLSFYVNLNLLNTYVRNVLGAVPTIIEGRESLIALQPFLEEEGISVERPSFGGFRDRLVFERVAFRHPDSTFELRDVNFTVNRGELFGIFGPSGSGKTTLIRLLTGLYAPEAGRVLVDGVEVGAYDGASYRSRIGVLSQNPLIFPGTVRDNLTYGLGGVDEARLREICRACQINDHVARLENGYDTEVGDFGATLSGGQKQRLALARALLREPELLILDEPDNNLDTSMIAEIIRSIRVLPITVILISHDERLMALVDRQYRLV